MGKNSTSFKKGDPRINRKGRPKAFDALRALAQQIAHEEVKKDGQPLIIDGHKVTVVEAILRKWATSPQHQQLFIEYAFGKVPTAVNMVWEVEIVGGIFIVFFPVFGRLLIPLF